MQIFEILMVLAIGGWNFTSLQPSQNIKFIKSKNNTSDKERRNSVMSVIKFPF